MASESTFQPSHDDLLWLAGLLEGEGAFDAHRGRYPRIRLQMTDRDVVERVAKLLGTTVRLSLKRAPASATWNAELSGDRAAEIMAALLPYMGARRSARIAEVLRDSAYYKGHTRPSLPGPRLTPDAPLALTA
ncbi:LAGLIDADG endonuclease [Microbacterium phage GardenState]|uniref:LAGLIDADG endonuclease n=2 Tax=Gardenstatevirus TaxID=3425012 RepID=A0A4Y6E716_9CAUD|nr:LAGLIDADG endonuclease [Microbacterium phage IAmGroot]QOI66944.1 LAGLIDADG endonuclease [Microbacterium phage GardenState]